MKKYINYLDVDFAVNQIGNFKLEKDFHTGALIWKNSCTNIFASPGWDGDEEIVAIQLEYYDDNGDQHMCDGNMFYIEHEYDLEAQKARYLEVIEAIIRQVDCMEFYTHYYEDMNQVLDNRFWEKFYIKANVNN